MTNPMPQIRIISLILSFISLSLIGSEKDSVTITAVGDLRISKRMIRNDSDDIQKIELNGDVVFANFEGVLSDADLDDEYIYFAGDSPKGYQWMDIGKFSENVETIKLVINKVYSGRVDDTCISEIVLRKEMDEKPKNRRAR